MGKIILFIMLILPWLTLLFLNKYSTKRFMPTAILGSLLVTIVFEIGYVYEWWKIQEKITPWDVITSVPLVYGEFRYFSNDVNYCCLYICISKVARRCYED